jgi:NitT/TauT family transport system permease protein
MVVNTMEGLESVDDDLMQLLDSLGASTVQEYRMVRIPNALPFIFDGLKIGVTLSVIGVITAEFILPQGGASTIGGLALLSLMNYNTTLAFSVVILTGFASVTVFFLLFVLQDRLVHWKESSMFTE